MRAPLVMGGGGPCRSHSPGWYHHRPPYLGICTTLYNNNVWQLPHSQDSLQAISQGMPPRPRLCTTLAFLPWSSVSTKGMERTLCRAAHSRVMVDVLHSFRMYLRRAVRQLGEHGGREGWPVGEEEAGEGGEVREGHPALQPLQPLAPPTPPPAQQAFLCCLTSRCWR